MLMNVQIEIPNVELSDVANFKRQITDYAQKLLKTLQKKEQLSASKESTTHSLSHLKGVLETFQNLSS